MMISILYTLLGTLLATGVPGAPVNQPAPTQSAEVPQTNPQADQADEGEEFNDDEEGYSLEDFQEEQEPQADES